MEGFLSEKQEKALKFFQENLGKLASNPLYKLKYVIVYDNSISGIFDTFDNALTEALSKYPQDGFVIQQVVTDNEVVNFLYPALA
jgi:hypothetical protein